MMDSAAGRQRKACIQCYQKKVRCEYSSDNLKCNRCSQHGLDCILPGSTEKTSRSSMRSGLEGLSSRVQHLEDILLFNADSTLEDVHSTLPASTENEQLSSSSDTGHGNSRSATSSKPSVVKLYRGATSPWTTLVSRLDGDTDSQHHLHSLQENAARLANDEKTSVLSGHALDFNILQQFPRIEKAEAVKFVKRYAEEAPYPILHYNSLMGMTEQLLDTHRLGRWGQIVCVLMYMAFGAAHINNIESSISPTHQSGMFVRSSWAILPQLFMDHDLWALKALTLMVHYLQASSKPEPCWALLGAASRIAVSLGFHQSSRKLEGYSAIEMEEGKRSWWLCYVMEKTFCSVFGYPSLTSFSRKKFNAGFPVPFALIHRPSEDGEYTNASIETSDEEAVEFFKDVIQLSFARDEALDINASELAEPERVSKLLRSILRDDAQGNYSPGPDLNLRDSISDLAHYNAVQVISMQVYMQSSTRLSLPADGILSARATLQIILETKTSGKTMCLWMWLYYAFTAAVVLFVQSLATPLHPNTILDLALLSDLQSLCAPMVSDSDGAQRIQKITEQMERVAFEIVKRAARKTGGKRSAEDEAPEELVMGKVQRTMRDSEGAEQESEKSKGSNTQYNAANETRTEKDRNEDDSGDGNDDVGREILETAPQSFEWDLWDQWLEDVPFELE